MKIPLANFQTHVNATIVSRGRAYFKNGYVKKLEEVEKDLYEALVKGTKNYTVSVALQNGAITAQHCDCPYDFGPVCKHAVAVFFRLRENTPAGNPLSISQNGNFTKPKKAAEPAADKKARPLSKTPTAKKHQTTAQQIIEQLERIPHGMLKKFVMEQSLKNGEYRDVFLSYFPAEQAPEPEDSKELYAKQAEETRRSATDKQGNIHPAGAKRIAKAMEKMLETAKKKTESGNHQSAFWICAAIIDNLTEVADNRAENKAAIEVAIDAAIDALFALIEKKGLAEDLKTMVFDYGLEAFDMLLCDDWRLSIDMLRLASNLIQTETEKQQVLNRIEFGQIPGDWKEYAQDVKRDMLK